MSKRAEWEREKLKARMQARNQKPEKPRFSEEANLNASLFNARNNMPKEGDVDQELFSSLQKNWDAGPNRDSGDALLEGFKSGMKSGSITEDKKRMQQYVAGMEKLKNMVSDTNERLYKEEKLDGARKSLEPRVFAYIEQANGMVPNDRLSYIRNSFKEYNKIAGTNYDPVATDAAEPWKVTFVDGDETHMLNLVDFVKSSPERQLDVYLKSNEAKNIERSAINQDAMEANDKAATRNLQNMKANKLQRESQEDVDYRNFEKRIKQETGDNVQVIESMPTSLRNAAEKHVQKYTELANNDLRMENMLTRAEKIAEDHPALFGNLNTIYATRYHEEPNYTYNILKNLIPEKDRDAAPELIGLVKNIFTNSVKGVTPKAMNMFLEQKMEAGTPNMRWTAKAFKKAVGESKKEYAADYDEHKKVSDYGGRGLYYRPRAKEREVAKKEPENEASVIQKIQQAKPHLSAEAIKEAQRRKNEGR